MAYAPLAQPSGRAERRPKHVGSVHASPIHPTAGYDGQTLTISSLQGDYIYVVLQVTRDLHPVECFDWFLPGLEFDIGVADVTLAQFEALAKSLGRWDIGMTGVSPRAWATAVSKSMVPLHQLLKVKGKF